MIYALTIIRYPWFPWVIAWSLPHMQYTSTIGYDAFSPANYVVNGFNPRPMCEANSFSKCIMGKTVPGYILQSIWTFLNHHTGNGSCTVLLKSANLAEVSYLLRCFFFCFCRPVKNIYLLFWPPKVKGQEAFPPRYSIHMQNHVLWSDEEMQFYLILF